MLWSYEKPTEPGLYLVNRGDVVTSDTLETQHFKMVDRRLRDKDGIPASSYGSHWKFLPIDYDYLNKIGNK